MPPIALPPPQLRALERLVGTWAVHGDRVEGTVRFDWMEGGMFLVQHVELHQGRLPIRGIEYIGFDQERGSLRSHYMDTAGVHRAYTWELDGDTLRIWLGDRGSESCFEGRFAADGNSYSGAWQWPGGGYEATLTRLD